MAENIQADRSQSHHRGASQYHGRARLLLGTTGCKAVEVRKFDLLRSGDEDQALFLNAESYQLLLK